MRILSAQKYDEPLFNKLIYTAQINIKATTIATLLLYFFQKNTFIIFFNEDKNYLCTGKSYTTSSCEPPQVWKQARISG